MKYKSVKESRGKSVKHQILLMCIFVLIGIATLVGTSYAVFSVLLVGKQEITLTAGVFEVKLEDGEYLKVPSLSSMTDKEGKKTEPYTFTIKNTGNMKALYTISLIEQSAIPGKELLNTQYLRYQITGTDGSSEIGTVQDLDKFFEGKEKELEATDGKNTITYELRLWISDNTPNSEQGKTFRCKVRVDAVQYVDYSDGSGANVPVLGDRLIPVVYNETQTRWEKANITTAKEWYNYEEQRWPNAVVVSPTNYTNTYKDAAAGTEVKMNDILQMYVWIPRYSYTIYNTYGVGGSSTSSPGQIDVKFVGTETKDQGTAKYTISGSPDNWYTPDAFTLGTQELSGLWVGKFEAGYSGASSTSDATSHNTSTESAKVIIKPDAYSWRSINVSNIYKTAKGITEAASTFGLSSETYDSHAMKNNEWGAVAYLTQSKYGKYGNSQYTGTNKEVYINNYNGYKTGCSAGATGASSSSTCTAYDDLTDQGSGKGLKGPGASTTGNIYGIYDMSGGAYEYVMGNLNQDSESSGFSGSWATDYKDYINFYKTTTATNDEFKSHAIGETSGWYGDSNDMVYDSSPWFVRGGHYSLTGNAGVFYYYNDSGNIGTNRSFRVVLTLKETA